MERNNAGKITHFTGSTLESAWYQLTELFCFRLMEKLLLGLLCLTNEEFAQNLRESTSSMRFSLVKSDPKKNKNDLTKEWMGSTSEESDAEYLVLKAGTKGR